MTLVVTWVAPAKLLDEDGPLGARSYDRHVPPQHVDKLRQLVNARLAEKRPHSGRARVPRWVADGPHRATLHFSVEAHRSKLQNFERLSIAPDSLLTKQHGPAGFNKDCK